MYQKKYYRNKDKIDALYEEYKNGKISYSHAVQKFQELSGSGNFESYDIVKAWDNTELKSKLVGE